MTSLTWFAVLQSLISAGLVTVLWVLHARLGGLGAVPGEPDAKAEAVLVLSQSPEAVDGLILHDGPKNGAGR